MIWRKLFFICVLSFIASIFWWFSSLGCVNFPELSTLRSGDIIFMRGISFRSAIVRLLEGVDSDYSHVGLVVIDGGLPYVIHVEPSRNPTSDRVVKESWSAIITPKRIKGAAVFRLVSCYPGTVPKKAARVALQFAREARPFDHDFDLHTPEKLYCTELVWLAYMNAGVDLRGFSFGTERKYLLPADLIKSGFLRNINSAELPSNKSASVAR